MQTALVPVISNGSVAFPANSRFVIPAEYDADPCVAEVSETAVDAAEIDPKDALIARLYATIERVEDELTQVYAELERAWAALEDARGTQAETLTADKAEAPRAEDFDTAQQPAPSPLAAESSAEIDDITAVVDELPEIDITSASDAPQPLDDSQPSSSHDDESHVDEQPPRDGMKISARHVRAVEMLASGVKTIHVAREVGVSRNSVQAWKRDAGFQALLNTHSNEMREAAAARLLTSANYAVSVLVDKVHAGDTKIALQLLKGLGLLTGKPSERGCESAEALKCNEM